MVMMMKKLVDNKSVKVYQCPHCGSGEITIDKKSKHHYGYCDTCDAAYIDYIPLEHQKDVHNSIALLKLLIGG